MQYDDELERMRARRQRSTDRREEEPWDEQKEPELDIMDFNTYDVDIDDSFYDDEEPVRQRRSPRPAPESRQTARQEYRPTSSVRSGSKTRHTKTSKQRRNEQQRNIASVKKKKKKRKIIFVELLVLFLIVGGVFHHFNTKDGDKPSGIFSLFSKKSSEGYWTVAVFGVDSRDGNLGKGTLSDVEMLCVIDRKTGEIKLVSVYRDTYLQIDSDGTFHKINEAYFKGGHKQAISALERNLDLKIDDYATFNWKAVADTINILGGIDIEITDSEFAYINSFITETVNSTGIGSHHLKSAGMNHLDGVQAVSYARLRLMDTDFNRTARQRKVISLAMEKAKKADFGVLNNILVTVLPQISTSIGINDLIPLAKNMGNYYLGTTDGFPFSRGNAKINKRSCVIPLTLESNVTQLHQILYGVENYQPSSTVKKISERIAKDSGMGDVAENAPKINTGGSGNSSKSPAPAETPAPETVPSEAAEEETTLEEETTEVTETPPDEESSAEESSTSEEIGPGIEKPSSSPADSATKPTPDGSAPPEISDGPGSPSDTSHPAGDTKPVPSAPGEDSSSDNSSQSGPGM